MKTCTEIEYVLFTLDESGDIVGKEWFRDEKDALQAAKEIELCRIVKRIWKAHSFDSMDTVIFEK